MKKKNTLMKWCEICEKWEKENKKIIHKKKRKIKNGRSLKKYTI